MRTNISKNIFIAMIGALLSLSLAAAAQQKKASAPAAQEPPADGFDYMSQKLGLTADQKPKVRAIVEQQMQQWEVLGKNKTLNGKQKIEMMKEINQSAEDRIEKLLTPAQRAKLHAIMEESIPKPTKPAPNRRKRPANEPPEE